MKIAQTLEDFRTVNTVKTIDRSISSKKEISQFAQGRGITCIVDEDALAAYAKDFGNLGYALPVAAFIPVNTIQVQEILAYIHAKKMQVVPRGGGYSQSGQSMAAPNGVSIDLRQINQYIKVTEHPDGAATVICDAGFELRELTAHTLDKGFIPPVLPFYQELTVGGVLSAGGIGSGSHLHGCFISNVLELEAIKGDGSMLMCSREKSPDIFYSLLGTLGQFGIITRVRLRLIRAKKIYRSFRLSYENIDNWLHDYRLLANSSISNLQGICIKSASTILKWNFLLEITIHSDDEGEPEANKLLAALQYDTLLQTTDLTPAKFVARFKSRFEQMRSTGKFEQHHPFLEFIVAEKKARSLIEYASEILPPTYEDGFRLIYINQKELPPFFMVPEAERICLFAVLPTGINKNDLPESLEAANKLHRFAMNLGCKRYLSGWMGMMNDEELEIHYRGKMKQLVQLKRVSDTGGIFQSSFSEKYFNLV